MRATDFDPEEADDAELKSFTRALVGGTELDARARLYGLRRKPGETDAELQVRITAEMLPP